MCQTPCSLKFETHLIWDFKRDRAPAGVEATVAIVQQQKMSPTIFMLPGVMIHVSRSKFAENYRGGLCFALQNVFEEQIFISSFFPSFFTKKKLDKLRTGSCPKIHSGEKNEGHH